jgi:hypothetical protein
MTDEERQRAMDFIVEQQAKFEVDIERLMSLIVKLTAGSIGMRESSS